MLLIAPLSLARGCSSSVVITVVLVTVFSIWLVALEYDYLAATSMMNCNHFKPDASRTVQWEEGEESPVSKGGASGWESCFAGDIILSSFICF